MKAFMYQVCLALLTELVLAHQYVAPCTNTEGKVFPSGSNVPKAVDSCNTCRCRNGEFIECTFMACPHTNGKRPCTNIEGKIYPSGEWAPNAEDLCNSCLCDNGRFTACTLKACLTPTVAPP